MSYQTLAEAEIADLRSLAGMIIPASAKYDVPGADDDTIFSDIVSSIGRDRNAVCVALATLRELAGGPFDTLEFLGGAVFGQPGRRLVARLGEPVVGCLREQAARGDDGDGVMPWV